MIASNPASRRAPDNVLADRFALARAVIIRCWPYLSSACLRLVPRWTTEVPTLAVDRYWRIYLNPDYVRSLTHEQLALLVAAHEIQHLLFRHSARLSEYRDVMLVGPGGAVSLANVAHDLAINSNLQAFVDAANAYQRGTAKVPHTFEFGPNKSPIPLDAVYPEKFKDAQGKPFPRGLVSEDYAKLFDGLPRAQRVNGGSSATDASGQSGQSDASEGAGGNKANKKGACAGSGTCGSGGGGQAGAWEDRDEPTAADFESGTTEAEQAVITRQVARAAAEQGGRLRGTVPAHISRWAEIALKPPRVPWQRVLRRVCLSALNWAQGLVDYSYRKPNRRVPDPRIVLPGLYSPKPTILLGFDTSGSMQQRDFEAAFCEVAALLKTHGMPRVPTIACDAAASGVKWIRRIEDVDLVGGGGTDMRVLIEAGIRVQGVRVIIVFTDGETPWPDSPTRGVRVVACLTREPSQPPPDWISVVRAFNCED